MSHPITGRPALYALGHGIYGIEGWDDDAALMFIPSGTDIMVPAFGYLIRREGHPATMPPWQDKTKIGDPMVYEVEDCIRPNLIETTVGGGTSDSGYYWDNAV